MSSTHFDETLANADAKRLAGDIEAALAGYLEAHTLEPKRIYPLYWLASLEETRGNRELAQKYCKLALAVDPRDIGLLLRYASICSGAGDDAQALATFEQVADLDPEVPGIDALLADHYCRLGQVHAGMAAFERALAADPQNVVLQSNLLFVGNFSDRLGAEENFARHAQWGRRHEAGIVRAPPRATGVRGRGQRLRIGYISPDLREHAVSSFFEPLLLAHDRERVEVHCFDLSLRPEDDVSTRLRLGVDRWSDVAHLDDATLAQTIRDAGIDVLVDMAGHTRGNRLLALRERPAPVQATWLGYLNTTGLASVDYRITDSYLDPPGLTEHLHTEKLVRLPVHACFVPADESVGAGPRTVRRPSRVILGSVNQWPKVSDSTKDAWAAILRQLPEAILRVVVRGGNQQAVREFVVDEFARRGVPPNQVEVFPFMSARAFLEWLGEIDLALDPYPYGGGTTTLHCLWMGVPVVTLAGTTPMSRNSVGPLSEVGLGDLINASPSAYVDCAIDLSRDALRRGQIRTDLRERLRASRYMDARGFARHFEAALIGMWEENVRSVADASARSPSASAL